MPSSEIYLNQALGELWQDQDIFATVSALEGDVFRHKEGRKTLRFQAGGKSYFLKYHRGIGWWEIVKNYLQLRAPITGAKNEWQAIRFLEQHGIDTMTLAGYGEKGRNPAEKQSFVITEDLSHTMSLELLGEQWHHHPPTFDTKRNLIEKLAEISKKMHENGMNHRDFYLVHFLLDKRFAQHNTITKETTLHLIDLHRALIRQDKMVPERWLIKDLGSLYFSAMDVRLTRRDLLRFIKVYTGQPLRVALQQGLFWQKVRQRAMKLRHADNAVVIDSLNPIRGFLKGKRDLAVPFDIEVAGQQYTCHKVLRLLPKKRLVVEATSAEQHVVIKLFSAEHKGRREVDREYDGYRAAKTAGANVPEFLSAAANNNGCLSIIYQYLPNAKTLLSLSRKERQSYCPALFETIARLHAYGVFQDDIHLDNFLVSEGKLYLVDLGSIKKQQLGTGLSPKKSLQNLAHLVSEFERDEQALLTPYIQSYYRHRQSQYNETEQQFFAKYCQKAWQYRKNHYLKKQFRSCTMTEYKTDRSVQAALRSDYLDMDITAFIDHIEQFIADGEALKKGNTATVVTAIVEGKKLVIKRYNIKGFWHFLNRCWRPSRAAISWRNANMLSFLGIATPKPVGFIEKRYWGLRGKAYFIAEYQEADELSSIYQQRSPTEAEINALRRLFAQLEQEQIIHGDLKASNVLLDNDGHIQLIDLDAMSDKQCRYTFQSALEKDKARFLANWQGQSIMSSFSFLQSK